MKRIGILTFHRALNVGACLQAFALAHYLKNNNHKISSELIDYTNNNFRRQRAIGYEGNNFLKRIAAFFLFGSKTRKKRISFDSFIEKTTISNFRYNEKNIFSAKNRYDYFIVGSDQVFNPFPSKNDTNFLLSFVSDPSKKFSYAASLGKNVLDEQLAMLYKKNLNDFSVLSIREETGINLLKQIGIKSPIRRDVDPTFLLSLDEWKQIINYMENSSKFVFVYEIFYDEILLSKAIHYAKKRNLPVVSNVTFKKNNPLNKALKHVECGPKQWLELMIGADAIFTNSFHGVAFSINFEKHFFINENKDKYGATITSRITDLLDETHLEYKHKALNNVDESFFDKIEDFSYAKTALKDNIEKSKKYLLSFGDHNEFGG